MIEVFGDLWEYKHKNRIIHCITTNGFVKSNGLAVMGAGTAKSAVGKFCTLSQDLAKHIKENGNVLGQIRVLYKFTMAEDVIITFPVKHKWWELADLALIETSAKALDEIAKANPNFVYLLPRPGCGNGGLKWSDVKVVIDFLPDNVHVIDRKQYEP